MMDGSPMRLGRFQFKRIFMRIADGSCLIATGNTRVICTASVEEAFRPSLKGRDRAGSRLNTAMLPASTGRRKSATASRRTVAAWRFSG